MVCSTFWRSRKFLTNLPKLSCGFNRANENHTVCGGFFIPVLPTRCRCLRSTSTPTGYSSLRRRGRSMIGSSSNQGETAFISYTGEPCYNRDLGTMKITLVVSGFSSYQGNTTKTCNELGPAKLTFYKRVYFIIFISDLFIKEIPLY